MNLVKKAIIVFSVLALMLVQAAPVYAASEQGVTHGKGKGLTKTETIQQPTAEEQNTAIAVSEVSNTENSTPTQAQNNNAMKAEIANKQLKQNTSDSQNVTPRGNNGTLKIHEQGTPSGTENNDPKVCSFNVEGFGFDTNQAGYLQFTVQGGDKPTGTNAGPYSFGPTNANGFYASQYFSLADGHYKATLYGKMLPSGQLTDIKAKSKVFKVRCGEVIGSTTCPTNTVWNDKNGNKIVDAGECVTGGKGGETPKTTDQNGQVLTAVTPKLANTGTSTLLVSLFALAAMLTAVVAGLRTKQSNNG